MAILRYAPGQYSYVTAYDEKKWHNKSEKKQSLTSTAYGKKNYIYQPKY